VIDLDAIPEALKEGENWPLLTLDENWVWLAKDGDGSVVGILIAAPCHGLVFIWRLKMLATAPNWALGKLLRRCIRDLRARKCLGYITWLDVCSRPEEMALARIAARAGALFTAATTVVVGSINAKHIGEK
jgi:hypothetical protein